MDNFISQILNDLFNLDPELKQHEKELTMLARTLMNAKPDSRYDEAFAAKLKSELMEKAQHFKTAAMPADEGMNRFFRLLANRFAYALAGAAIMLIIILPLIFSGRGGKLALNSNAPASLFKSGVTRVDDHAFGSITDGSAASGDSQGLGAGGREVAPMQNESGFTTDSALGQASVPAGSGGGGGMAAPAPDSSASAKIGIMPPSYMTDYKYVYTGDDITIDRDTMPVYKRVTSPAGAQALAQTVTGFNFGTIDLSRFENAELANLNLNENRDFGYSLYLNFTDNTLDISQNWQKWPHPENQCRDQACYNQYRLSISDVPTDDKILSIAKGFLDQYGIDAGDYGEPFVQDQWRLYYAQAPDQSQVYIPEEMAVVYPYIIDGQMAYDQSGNPTGMYVGVDIRYDKVSSLHSLKPQTFESSDYAVINDSAKITDLAEKGGVWPNYRYEGADKTVTVELGTPQPGLVQYWKYNQTDGSSEELYIPALVFPVKNQTELGADFSRKNVVVPLAKDLLDEMNPPAGIPRPMPLMKEGTQSSETPAVEILPNAAPGAVKGAEESVGPREIRTTIRFER